MDHRKAEQTLPHLSSLGRTPEEQFLVDAEVVIFMQQAEDSLKVHEEEMAQLTPGEQERLSIEAKFDDLNEAPTMSTRVTRAFTFGREILMTMYEQDKYFMEPIFTAMMKRPQREFKASRTIAIKGIKTGVDDYGEYIPLWNRF